MSLDTHNAFGYKYIAVSLLCVNTIHCSSFIAKCQYNTLQLHCQVLIQYSEASLPSVNTIHCSFIAKCQYNTLQLHCQVSIQYIAASLPSVSTTALEMFCGAKHTHYTFTPVIKHHSTGTTANIGVNVTDKKKKKIQLLY